MIYFPGLFALSEHPLLASGSGPRGRQIAGRFTVVPTTAFAYGTTEQRDAWNALITTLESTLRLREHPPGTLTAMAEHLYQRSGGMIGSLSQLIRTTKRPATSPRSATPPTP